MPVLADLLDALRTGRVEVVDLTAPLHSDTPIIMLTTESSDEMKNKGRAAGATGWMVKPFDPNRLLEVVRKFVN